MKTASLVILCSLRSYTRLRKTPTVLTRGFRLSIWRLEPGARGQLESMAAGNM